MNIELSEKLKTLRREKGVSQEKLASYLDVSFQAVSKWENGGAYPDISLLPEIARFYGITVDELLQVERIDERRLYGEYEARARDLARGGNREATLDLWLEAYKKMPNNTEVKEMLMSTYFDLDCVKYRDQIVELGMELYNSDAPSYYKGQAICQIARTYFATGQADLADKWAGKSYPIHSARDILYTEIHDGPELLADVGFCAYWFFRSLFYMAIRLNDSESVPLDKKQKQNLFSTLIRLYETLYPNGEMEYELFESLRTMHVLFAEREIELGCGEAVVREHLEKALELAEASMTVTEHDLSQPFLHGWHVLAAPEDNKRWVRNMKRDLAEDRYDKFRETEWFRALETRLLKLLQ